MKNCFFVLFAILVISLKGQVNPVDLDCTPDPNGDIQTYWNVETYKPMMDGQFLHDCPITTIELNFNIWQRSDGSGNFHNTTEDKAALLEVLDMINYRYAHYGPSDPVIDPEDELPGYDSRIRFSLGEPGEERIYFCQDSPSNELYCCTEGDYFLSYLQDEYPERLKQLNVFFVGGFLSGDLIEENIHITNGGSGYTTAPQVIFTYNSCSFGYVQANSIINNNGEVIAVEKTAGGLSMYGCAPEISFEGGGGTGATAYCTLTGGWGGQAPLPSENLNQNLYFVRVGNTGENPADEGMAVNLTHELAHNLDLNHTYSSNICENDDDYLSDVFGPWSPDNPNCPHNHDCDNAYLSQTDLCTNNIMGEEDTKYISPRQAGIMHRSLALLSTRKYVNDDVFIDNAPLVITDDQTWDFNIKLYRDIVVEPAVELTISCKVVMPWQGKIVVKPNGKLIVDGGTITTDSKDHAWQGIEIWGTSDKSQYYDPLYKQFWQGTLILKNNAIIENAKSAVQLWRPGYPATAGGIVQATNSSFINNAKSVLFVPYNNFNPYVHGNPERDNISYFKNCTFELNSNYFADNPFIEHALLGKVKGIKFIACDFSVVQTEGVFPDNRAIASSSAGFSVSAVCNSPVLPCTDYDKCTFTGFYKGIYATNDGTNTNTFSVNRAIFTDNSYGISMSNVHNASVLLSEFYIGYNAADQDNCDGKSSGYGIDITAGAGFAIEENYFTKAPGAPLGNYIGIRVNDCPSESDNIYLNEFLALSVANLAEGYNRSNPLWDWTGTAYLCNQNSYNSYDFHVATNSMIKGSMGGVTYPSGNVLTYPPVAIMQFQNDGTQNVEFYYNNSEPVEWLTEYTTNVSSIPINYNNTCPSHYGGGGGGTDGRVVLTEDEILQREQEFYTNLVNYNNVEALYESLKDGGNTEQLQSEVATAWPSDMWELRAKLLGDSPHLSKEVLMTVANKTDVLPESVLFEILAANPDELRKEELISYLENKAQPLPEYMIDILRQVSNGVTYKTALKSQMASYYSKKVNAAQDIMRSLMNDSITDLNLLRNWLDNIGGYEADKQIIASYISEDDYFSAQNLLQIIPSLYNFTSDQIAEFNQYKSFTEWMIGLYQQNRTIFDLDSLELAYLVNIADNGTGSTAYNARGILEFAYGYHYCDCPELPEIAGLKSSKIDTDLVGNNFGLEINAKPNPAKEWVAFDYHLPIGINTVTLQITDIAGKVVAFITLTGNSGQHVWDSRKVNPGVYFYTINAGNASKCDKIVVE